MVGFLISLIVSRLVNPKVQRIEWRRLPGALMATGQYLALLIYELIVGGIQVAQIVLNPSLPMKQGIIAIPSEGESDLATALSAHAITLAPGEMVVEIDDDNVMYTHVLDVSKAEQHFANAQQQRRDLLQKIFV